MTATRRLPFTLENAGPLFTSVTAPQPMIPQRTSSMRADVRGSRRARQRLSAAAHADRVIPMGNRMHGHDRIAAFLRPTREKTTDEGAFRVVDPLVLVADHVVD